MRLMGLMGLMGFMRLMRLMELIGLIKLLEVESYVPDAPCVRQTSFRSMTFFHLASLNLFLQVLTDQPKKRFISTILTLFGILYSRFSRLHLFLYLCAPYEKHPQFLRHCPY